MARPAYETREVTHGNAFGAFASITKNAEGQVEFGTPAIFTGLRGNNFETTQESNPYYADNVEHVRLSGAETTEGSITVYQFPESFVINHLGKKKAANGMLTNTGTKKNFVWQYIETITDEFGEEYEELHIFYNVKASNPTSESQTDEDSAEPKEFEIPVTASPNPAVLDADDKPVTEAVIRKTEANAALFELAYTEVILPTTQIPTGGI
ncbi:major tail protein [Enterococcus dispar]|uniref:Phage tail tube protein N-terminal domain-containing protein n=1 Tax=Enterococcus dispar ATCC 51266 TaxID=1139219 RepID=S1NGH0_9ENTE|nr:major tail protein [Enterococcus dispar]EOT42746.1 hypothetical protein OMK_01107 [Enterococcus dispar ATCC 51266]EOW84803.1 hypothetical protein I569_00092 [Enterococcus dispar ATCC 51266]OJG38452.1 hypothetical protein RV01_GL002507 [Enterococcus dispar]